MEKKISASWSMFFIPAEIWHSGESRGLMKDLASSWDRFPPGINTAFAVLGKVGVDEHPEADYATTK